MSKNDRDIVLQHARKKLSGQWLHLQIMFILALAGAASFLASFVLLKFGVTAMVVRYPLAIMAAYGVFILLIGVWLWLQREENSLGDIDVVSGLDGIPIRIPTDWGTTVSTSTTPFRQGGDFGGGGAGGAIDGNGAPTNLSSGNFSGGNYSSNYSSGSSSSFDLPGLDADDAIWIVLAVLLLLGGLIAIGYVVWIAPVLFAEVLVDGLLAAGLYKSLKNAGGRFWFTTVLYKTAIPLIVVVVFFSLAGYCVQRAIPEASSIGEAIRIIFQ